MRIERKKHRGARYLCLPMLCLVGLLCGCSLPEWMAQVPAEVSLQEKPRNPKEYRDEAEDSPAQSDDEQEVREITLQDVEDLSGQGFLYDGGSRYAYDSLGDSEKLWYRDIEQILGSMAEKVKLSGEGIEAGLDETSIDKIFQCVLCDHPELFYVQGYSYTQYTRGEKTVDIDFSGTYSMDRETAEARKAEIEAEVAALLNAAAGLDGDYEKLKYVYEAIIRDTDYDISAPENQNIYSVFVNHVSVCQGYAKAAQYLLNRLGVFCTLVQGSVRETGEGHAWNLVKADGDFYYFDATWGDISYTESEVDADGWLPGISYDYLCVTTEQIRQTHCIDSLVEMPLCEAEKDNYYVRENAVFSEFDRDQMSELVDKAMEQGRQDITLRCASKACYDEMCDVLLEQQEIFSFLTETGVGTYAYTKNDAQWTLTFFMMTNEG